MPGIVIRSEGKGVASIQPRYLNMAPGLDGLRVSIINLLVIR